MKKQTRTLRFLAMLLVACLMVSMFIACGKTATPTDSTSAAGTGAATTEPTTAEPVKLKVFTAQHYEMPPTGVDSSDNKFINMMEQATNTDLTWEIVPNEQYNDKKNLIMASGEFPDLIWGGMGDIIQWSSQDLIQPLDEAIAKVKPDLITKDIPEAVAINGVYNGKQYGLPTWYTGSMDANCLFIRGDWLKNVGLAAPTTTEEFYNVLKAFTYNDPDKDGKNDTYGIGSDKWFNQMGGIYNSFDVPLYQWSIVDGKMMPNFIRPEMKEALLFIGRLYKEKIMNPETLVHDYSKWDENIKTGTYGAAYQSSFYMLNEVDPLLKKDNPEAFFMPLEPVKGPTGAQIMNFNSGIEGQYIVTAACKNPEKIIELFKWSYEGPRFATGSDALVYGKDKEYAIDIGGYPYGKHGDDLPEELRNDGYRLNYLLAWDSVNRIQGDEAVKYVKSVVAAGKLPQGFDDTVKFYEKFAVPPVKVFSAPEENTNAGEIGKELEQVMIGMITGKKGPEDFDKFVKFYYDMGGQTIIDAVNKVHGK